MEKQKQMKLFSVSKSINNQDQEGKPSKKATARDKGYIADKSQLKTILQTLTELRNKKKVKNERR